MDTTPEETLHAFADHGKVSGVDAGRRRRPASRPSPSSPRPGIDLDALAATLQKEGAEAFVKSWNELIACIAGKRDALRKAS